MSAKSFTIRIGILGLLVLLTVALADGPYVLMHLRQWFGVAHNTEHVLQPGDHEPEQSVKNEVRIPSLGIVAPIQYITEANEAVFQRALQDGVVQYPGTVEPGKVGNTYIFGHSSDFALAAGNYKTVFARLPDIQKNAEIEVSDGEGTVYRYRVFETKVVENTDLSVLSQDTQGRVILSLQTSYPVGTALQRFVVVAELVQ